MEEAVKMYQALMVMIGKEERAEEEEEEVKYLTKYEYT